VRESDTTTRVDPTPGASLREFNIHSDFVTVIYHSAKDPDSDSDSTRFSSILRTRRHFWGLDIRTLGGLLVLRGRQGLFSQTFAFENL
jgi:hypothetical protein